MSKTVITRMFFYFIMGSFMFVYCAGQKVTDKNIGGIDKETVKDKQFEDFDPVTLGDYKTHDVNGKSAEGFYSINHFLVPDKVDTTHSKEQMPGYRVQLVATRNEIEARTVKLDAVLTFQTNVYMIYDNPYYKIRVGDCASRFDANDLQELAVKKGFNEAWVVKTNIFKHTTVIEDNK